MARPAANVVPIPYKITRRLTPTIPIGSNDPTVCYSNVLLWGFPCKPQDIVVTPSANSDEEALAFKVKKNALEKMTDIELGLEAVRQG
jgi:hypothetical protein